MGVVEARWPEAQAMRRVCSLSELPTLHGRPAFTNPQPR
jgi:hypothetical protein